MAKQFKKRKSVVQKKINIPVNTSDIDYKKPEVLRQFMSSRFKIYPRKISGLSAKKQRKLQLEVKKSRIVGLLPFTDRHYLG